MSLVLAIRSAIIRAALLLSFSTVWLISSPAMAGGFGGYFEYSRVAQEIEFEFVDATFTSNRLGVGLIVDTNVVRDELLNLRGSFGYVYTENTVDDEAHGGAIDLALGFGLWRGLDFRLWAGPAIRSSVDFYDNSTAQVLDISVGGGARFGLNWHVNSRVSVSPSISYQYLYVRETIKDDFGKDEFDGHKQLITARLTFMFRNGADVF